MKPWASVIGGENEKEKTKRIVIIKEIISHEKDLIKTNPQNHAGGGPKQNRSIKIFLAKLGSVSFCMHDRNDVF
jgi:hypothetical protein